MLVECNLNHPFSGNLSWQKKKGFWITRTGVMKNRLERRDFILCTSHIPPEASVEAIVHRAIYEKTDARTIIHSHPPYAIALSFTRKNIEPEDTEGKYFTPRIPVLALKNPVGSQESASTVSTILQNYPCVLLQGHGLFAKGGTLREAFKIVCVSESVCKIIHLKKSLMNSQD